MTTKNTETEHIHLASGHLVSDIIRGLRSGCVQTFRSCVQYGTHNEDEVPAFIPSIAEDTVDNEDEFMYSLIQRSEEEGNENSTDNSALTTEVAAENVFTKMLLERSSDNSQPTTELTEKDDVTRLLAKTSNESAVYAGSAGSIGGDFADLMRIDRLYLPIREEGVFRMGLRKKETVQYVFVHSKDMLSHSYLQTHADGVLHVLPGWDHSSFIHDISYRFNPGHTYVAEIPFLGGEVCRVRTGTCKGVFVCPAPSEEYRSTSHCAVDPHDKNILESIETQDPHELARKKVNGIYQSLKAREERRKGFFCGFPIPDLSNSKETLACRGGPKIILRRQETFNQQGNAHNTHLRAHWQRRCDYFIGCSGYQDTHGKHNIKHYSRSLDIDNEMVPYLKRLLSGVEESGTSYGDCNFVREKNKGKRTCPRHGLRLIELPCKKERNDKYGNHKMCTFEPVMMSNLPMEHRILYVTCIGEHLHPPPPPPEATVKKLQILHDVCNETGIHCSGKLRKEVQRRFLEAKQGDRTDGMTKFNGSLAIPDGCIKKALKSIRLPIPKLASEVGELAILAAGDEMPYVRDSKMVDGGHAFFLTLDELLLFAVTAKSFAGDATYQTVTEANRATKDGRWYLYNIIAHASSDHLNGSGVIVMRALMTGLTKNYYYAVWKYFFDSLVKASNLLRGALDLDYGCIKIPYMEVPRALESRSCLITSITMDFDAAEIHGCAEALASMCGGSMQTHIKGMFIGCEVHLKRDLLRRARDGDRQRATRKSSTELYSSYAAYAYASTPEEAETELAKIKTFDSDWVNWVERQCMGPLISACTSQMTSVHRTIGFSNTNVVESHNRRGNHLVGTRLRPAEAAKGLYNIDRIDAERLGRGDFN